MNLVFQLIQCFFYVSFSYFSLVISFYFILVFFLVFVNLLSIFDVWMLYFSSKLIPSYICLSHIGSNTFYKKRVYIFLFSFPTLYDLMAFFTFSCLSFCSSLCLSLLWQIDFFLFSFLICILAYLNDYFSIVISSFLHLLSFFLFRGDHLIFI